MKMVIKDVRVDWLFCFEPGAKGKYGVCVLMPKGSPQHKQVEAAVEEAKGIAINKFTKAQTQSSAFKPCLRDGDEEIKSEGRPAHYAGMMFFNANNKEQPGIVGPKAEPLMDRNRLYSGCFCHVDVNFFPFNTESKGVGCGFNNIMLVRDGERLDGRTTAEDAFAGLVEETNADNLQ
jgi:hypothetical protein